jgi:hypothetical protein
VYIYECTYIEKCIYRISLDTFFSHKLRSLEYAADPAGINESPFPIEPSVILCTSPCTSISFDIFEKFAAVIKDGGRNHGRSGDLIRR